MTAVIGILNKEGAVVAADSAVTMTRGRREKISNSADKMIRLSDAQPISAVIFSDACFMGIPWDIIIRWYRHRRGRIAFPSFKDHVNDFLGFLVEEKFFCSESQNKDYLGRIFRYFFQEVDREVPDLQFNDDFEPSNVEEVVEGYRSAFQAKAEECKEKGICLSMEDYPLESFSRYAEDILDNSRFGNLMYDEVYAAVRGIILESFYYYLIHRNERMTGLLFTCYGRDDDYPSSLCVRVVLGFDGRLVSYVLPEDDVTISDERPYAVLPYAQTDVMQTLVEGVDPRLDYNLGLAAGDALERMRDELKFEIEMGDYPEEMADLVGMIPYEDLVEDFMRTMHDKMRKARTEVFRCVEKLPVREMARLAEEMVSITAVKRHINFDDEGVGGLVDLAAITRSKGFTWLNRKGWYDALGEDGFQI